MATLADAHFVDSDITGTSGLDSWTSNNYAPAGTGFLSNFFIGAFLRVSNDKDIVYKFISADGDLSTTWSGNGAWGEGISGSTLDRCRDLYFDSDKNAYIGFTGANVEHLGDKVAKLDPDGVLITSWGQDGYIGSQAPQPNTSFRALAVDDDGTTYVASTSGGGGDVPVLTKYDPDGAIVTAFGSSGSVYWRFTPGNRAIPLQISKLVIRGDNIYIAGDADTDGSTLDRYNVCAYNKTTGSLDTTWATNGFSYTIPETSGGAAQDASSISFDEDGKMYIFVTDFANTGTLYRLNADGSKDATFNKNFTDGAVPIPVAWDASAGYDSQIDKDGNIWAVFYLNGTATHRIKKFNPAGTELVSIEVDGGENKFARCIYTDNDFVYIGSETGWGGFQNLIRYSLEGVRDTGFGVNVGDNNSSPSVIKPTGDIPTDRIKTGEQNRTTAMPTNRSHLEGEIVDILEDGVVQPDQTVTNGGVTGITGVAHIGLNYVTTIKPSKLDIEGMGINLTKKITKPVLSFYNTLKGKVGPDTTRMETISFDTDLFTGIKEVPINDGYDRDADIIIQQDEPLPLTCRGMVLDTGAYIK